ncbi:MAG: FecR family protein [Bacteroidales bacterium]|nr:FecR family protein [Bacteroidales bacterium]
MENRLEKYLANDMDNEELRTFMEQSAESPEGKDELLSMKLAEMQTDAFLTDSGEIEQSWRKTSRRINRTRTWIISSVSAAASLLAVAGCCYMFLSRTASVPDYLANGICIETGPGQRTSTTLPDGTIVHLNECSKLSFNPYGWKKERVAELEGQASFDVFHYDEVPFSIRTEFFTVNDIGTSFEISGYEGDEIHFVRLISGEVSVDISGSGCPEFLSPGQTLVMNTLTGDSHIEKTEEKSDSFTWQNGYIVFEDNTLAEMKQVLYRHFGYEFIISDDCGEFRYTAIFENDSVSELMDIIQTMSPAVRYSIDTGARTVTVWKSRD